MQYIAYWEPQCPGFGDPKPPKPVLGFEKNIIYRNKKIVYFQYFYLLQK